MSKVAPGSPIDPLVCPRGHHSIEVSANRFRCRACENQGREQRSWDRSELVDLRDQEPPLRGDREIATDGGTDVIEIIPAQRERFDRIREACANEHVPAPTDQSMFKSLLDEWEREDIEHGHELVVLLRDLQNAAANARSNDAEQCAVTLESFADDVEELVGV